MLPKLTNADIMERVSRFAFQRLGVGLLITGPSRDERSKMANMVLRQFVDAGHPCLSLTPFELVAAYHFGQSDRLCRVDVLLINDLGALSQAEQDAIDIIKPTFSVTGIIETILDQRHANAATTLVTTEHELPELETQFSPRLASLVGAVGFSIQLDG
jgi:hypothetical protein